MSSVQKQCIDIKSQEDCNIQENCSWASGKKRSFCRTKKNKHDVEDKKKPSTKGRCKKGTRRNKATGLCEKHKASSAKASPVSASPVSASPVSASPVRLYLLRLYLLRLYLLRLYLLRLYLLRLYLLRPL